MPRVKIKDPEVGRRPFRPDERVRALEAGFAEVDGESYGWSTGQEFDADYPPVVACPNSFMPASTPANEVVDWLPEPRYEEPDPSSFNIRPQVEIPTERMVICLEGLGDFSRFVSRGQIVDVRDPFVKQWPQNFSIYKPLSAEDVERMSE